MSSSVLKKSRLGTLLVSRNLITPEQLSAAVREQNIHPELPLGQVLVQQELITQRQLTRALRWQSNIRCATLAVAFTMLPLQVATAATPKIVPLGNLTEKWTSITNFLSPLIGDLMHDKNENTIRWDVNIPLTTKTYPTFQFKESLPTDGNALNKLILFISENSTRNFDDQDGGYTVNMQMNGAVLNLNWDY